MPDEPDGTADDSPSPEWPDPPPDRDRAQTIILTIAAVWFLVVFLVLLALLYAGMRGASPG